MSGPARRVVLLLLLLGACNPAAGPDFVSAFEWVEGEAFAGHNPSMGIQAFDMVAADADLDGDRDLLINWHHLGPLEYYRNDDGVLRLSDAGLAANAVAPGLFRSAFDAEAAATVPGLYLWHDTNPGGAWQFLWHDPAAEFGGFTADLETSLRYRKTSGLADDEIAELDERRRTVTIPAGETRRRFSVTTDPIGVRFAVRLRSAAGVVPPLFAGVPPVEQPGEVSLWKPDPHGMAWLDVEGSAHPELVVTRGGLSGELLPPLAPKADRYYAHDGAYTLRPLPPGYGRGRGVEWVDVDNDGSLELSVANEATPNRLFAFESGGFVDRAGDLGIDLVGSGVQCWGDADGDGFQDLFHLEETRVRVLLNRQGGKFVTADGPGFDLSLPPVAAREISDLFDRASLRLADFDADGDLDLWVLGRGEERRNTLFLRMDQGYVDVGKRAGVASIVGNAVTVLADLDNDGYEDLFAPGAEPALWVNDRGRRLVPIALPFDLDPRIEAATAFDIDADGRTDLVFAAWTRFVLRNRTGGTSFTVELRDSRGNPVGAVVTALYADGKRVARRWGSERTTYSQVTGPLRFASGASNVEVLWPGDLAVTSHEVPADGGRVVLERGL